LLIDSELRKALTDELVRAIIQLGTKPHCLTWQCHGPSILFYSTSQPHRLPDQKKMATSPITINPSSSSSEYESPILLSSKDQVTGGSVQTIYKEDSSRQATCTFLLYIYYIYVYFLSIQRVGRSIHQVEQMPCSPAACWRLQLIMQLDEWMDPWIDR
jgi:hypothetical protein